METKLENIESRSQGNSGANNFVQEYPKLSEFKNYPLSSAAGTETIPIAIEGVIVMAKPIQIT